MVLLRKAALHYLILTHSLRQVLCYLPHECSLNLCSQSRHTPTQAAQEKVILAKRLLWFGCILDSRHPCGAEDSNIQAMQEGFSHAWC